MWNLSNDLGADNYTRDFDFQIRFDSKGLFNHITVCYYQKKIGFTDLL